MSLGAQELLPRGPRLICTRMAAVGAITCGVAAAILGGGSVQCFVQRGTTVHPAHPEESSVLVTDGPNRFTRNPMYLALALALVGNAFRRRSIVSLLPAVWFMSWLTRIQIRPEETALEARFGDDYRRYAASTPRWFWRRRS